MQVKATIKISHVDLDKSHKLMTKADEVKLHTWKTFACHLDFKYLTCSEKINKSNFLLQVPPGINYVPKVGDIVHLIKSKRFSDCSISSFFCTSIRLFLSCKSFVLSSFSWLRKK